METIGWLGNLLLALCSAPLVVEAFVKKRSNISAPFYFNWFFGVLLTLSYLLYNKCFVYNKCLEKTEYDSLILNYSANLCSLIFIGYFRFKRRN